MKNRRVIHKFWSASLLPTQLWKQTFSNRWFFLRLISVTFFEQLPVWKSSRSCSNSEEADILSEYSYLPHQYCSVDGYCYSLKDATQGAILLGLIYSQTSNPPSFVEQMRFVRMTKSKIPSVYSQSGQRHIDSRCSSLNSFVLWFCGDLNDSLRPLYNS